MFLYIILHEIYMINIDPITFFLNFLYIKDALITITITIITITIDLLGIPIKPTPGMWILTCINDMI